jgi:hypothetical protein
MGQPQGLDQDSCIFNDAGAALSFHSRKLPQLSNVRNGWAADIWRGRLDGRFTQGWC